MRRFLRQPWNVSRISMFPMVAVFIPSAYAHPPLTPPPPPPPPLPPPSKFRSFSGLSGDILSKNQPFDLYRAGQFSLVGCREIPPPFSAATDRQGP